MSDSGIALFDTPIGTCGIAWRPGGLVGVQLPEASEDAALRRLRRRFPKLTLEPPPAWVEQAVTAIQALLSGDRVDLSFVPLDYTVLGAFEASVLRAAREIKPGQTTTYGALAAQVGDAKAAQAVGQALGHNPWPIVVPCHRVTAAAGRTGGFSAHGGAATKLKLLEIEGALAVEALPLFAERPES